MGHIPAEHELLCESCGYDIGGIDPTRQCPECGRAVERSVPERREGSPWQRGPSIRSWVHTNCLMLLRPRNVFDRMRVDDGGYLGLLAANLGLAGAMLALPWVGTLIGDPARSARNSSLVIQILTSVRSAVLGTIGVAMVLFLLTAVEAMGIRFFGRRKGWRITKNIAWQVCAHASIGWIVAAALTQLSLVLYLNLSFFGLSGWLERRGSIGNYLMASVPLAGFLAGMLFFEALVYMGMRRCRFANAPRA